MFKKRKFLVPIFVVGVFITSTALAFYVQGANDPGILEPVLSALTGQDVRIPNTDQVSGGVQLNVVGAVVSRDADDALSITGEVIKEVSSPNGDVAQALSDLEDAARDDDQDEMEAVAAEIEAILLGTTQGRIYDGFALLSYNQGAYVADHEAGEYKMKTLRHTGLTALSSMDGKTHKIWEVDVNMLWYDEQFDADTFLLRVPVAAHKFDTFRINYRIYSLVREEFSPTTVLTDTPTSVKFPFKGLDSTWIQIHGDSVTELTVEYPPLGLFRGIYTWGWRAHPGRVQFLQPVYEITNAHTGNVELAPEGMSYAYRNQQLSIAGIGDAAPEKKMYNVAQAVLGGADAADVLDMLTDGNTAPRGTWQEWIDLAVDQLQLPPEAWDMLAAEGIQEDDFGPYDFVTVYLNNEMYGDGPQGGGRISSFAQGENARVKVINLDNHTHYFRNVDFGPPLHDDIASVGNAAGHSFEIFNFKPTYGAPKVAEMQWRAGWGFRPHFNVIQQPDTFPRPEDNVALQPYTDGEGVSHTGYQYSAGARQGDFRFNPPPFIIGQSFANPSSQRLQEADGSFGLVIGQLTPGYGTAKMCGGAPTGPMDFCPPIDPTYNPYGALNFPPPPMMMPATMLRFPPFLRNPNPNGGDIIPPTPVWKPFLYINPTNGTLFNNGIDASDGYWTDLTYAHGAPISAGTAITAMIESPRASGQVFYQFDDLFHDNAIFSPHTKN